MFLSLDHSRFDSCVRVEHLKELHTKYRRLINSKEFYGLCCKQYNNQGITHHGIRYTARGTRMSGDTDTGLGNTCINVDVLYAFLKYNRVSKYEMMVDGDDSIIIVEKQELDYTIFNPLGFLTKVEITEDINKVTFCQTRLINLQEPIMIRSPLRILANTSVSRKNYHRSQYAAWLAANGDCELACNKGVPFTQSYAEHLRSLTDKRIYDEDIQYKMMTEPVSAPITVQARYEMLKAWGVDMVIAEVLETSIRKSVIVCSGALDNDKTERTRRLYESIPAFGGGSWWCRG